MLPFGIEQQLRTALEGRAATAPQRTVQRVPEQAPVDAGGAGDVDRGADGAERWEAGAGGAGVDELGVADVAEPPLPPLPQLGQQVGEPVDLLLGGGHVQRADGLVAGVDLTVLCEARQQLRVPGDGNPHQAEQVGVPALETTARREDPGAGRRRLALVPAVDQDRLAALAGHLVGGARADQPTADHHHHPGTLAGRHRQWLIGRPRTGERKVGTRGMASDPT